MVGSSEAMLLSCLDEHMWSEHYGKNSKLAFVNIMMFALRHLLVTYWFLA